MEEEGEGGREGGSDIVLLILFLFLIISGCPEAIKVLVGNKADLSPEVDMTQVKVSKIII